MSELPIPSSAQASLLWVCSLRKTLLMRLIRWEFWKPAAKAEHRREPYQLELVYSMVGGGEPLVCGP